MRAMAPRALSLIALSVVLATAPGRGLAQDDERTRNAASSPDSTANEPQAETGDNRVDAASPLASQPTEEPPEAPIPSSDDGQDEATVGEADVYRPLGPNLFPFYVHELRTSDQTEITEVLWLFGHTSSPDGSSSLRLLPFFWRVHEVDPPDDRLFIFPFWYSRESPEASSLFLFPFYWSHETPSTSFDLLAPLWLRRENREERWRDLWVLPPFYRNRSDEVHPDRPVTSQRFGFWKILELWESRETPNTVDRTAFNLLNWGEETESGLALYRSRWIRESWGERGSRYLFPFFWQGTGASSGYLWIVPLFGYSDDGARRDWTLVPLLSRYGRGPGPARRIDVLFPFFHYAREEDSFSLASYPFFDWYQSGPRHHLGILFWLYRHYVDEEHGTESHNVLFPLASFRSSRDGAEGRNWLFPYFEAWNTERRIRFIVPVHFHWNDVVEGHDDWYTTWTAPAYFSWGTPEDWFAFGFPLYWASHEGERSWSVFAPFYWRFESRATDSFDLLPFLSYRTAPHGSTWAVLGPLYAYQRFYGPDESLRGTAHHVLWPFFKASFLENGYDWRVLPFFWIFRRDDRSGAMITPFWYRESGPTGTFSYFFPIRARFESPREEIEYRALGSWIRHDLLAPDGEVTSRTTHWFWWLATFEENRAESMIHRRILPLGYWHTETPSRSRTVLGPFWYSHSIPENDLVHHLDLVLGNLYFSKVVEGPPPRAPRPVTELAEGDTASRAAAESRIEVGAQNLEPPAENKGATAVDPQLIVRSEDRGILWPLTRWYENDRGESGRWILPFWFDVENSVESRSGILPFFYWSSSNASYDPSYFRYFYLVDRETYSGGSRTTIGQLLFDWETSGNDEYRLRLLYPFFEFSKGESSSSYSITPLVSGESSDLGGHRESSHRFFPLFWAGSSERLENDEWNVYARHWFLFPLFGYERRERRIDYNALYPFFHLQSTPESFNIELWPILFYRENPAIGALRLWPFHAHEHGETAGDFWVSKYLFFSKWFERRDSFDYRLDPFLFRYHRSVDEFGIGGLFEAFAWDRSPDSSSFRMIPFVFGYASKDSATTAVIPFHYQHDFGDEPVDFWHWPRFFFLTNLLEGGRGERRFGVFANLFDYTWDVTRPDYSELRILHRVVFNYHSETAQQFEINPLFQYYRNDVEGVRSLSILFSLYRQETTRDGETRRTLFYFIPF